MMGKKFTGAGRKPRITNEQGFAGTLARGIDNLVDVRGLKKKAIYLKKRK